MKKCLAALALFLTMSVPPSYAQTYTLDQVLAKLDQTGKNFKSLEAGIARTKVTILVNDRSTDTGKIYVSRQGDTTRAKIDFTAPTPQSLLLDKGKALLYYPKVKQAQEFDLGKGSGSKAAGFFLMGFAQSGGDLKRDYDAALVGSEVIDGQKTTMLELKPRSKELAANIKSITLWLDEQRWIPLQTKHAEASGDYQISKLSNIKLNAGVPNSVFTLKIPSDVKISKGGSF